MSALPALLLVTLLVNAPTTGVPSENSHELEVRALASTLAITEMVSERCADILINRDLVRHLGRLAHYEKKWDSSLLAIEGRAVVVVLKNAIAEAPSLQVWCDGVYGLFGPTGTLIRDLMRRERPSQVSHGQDRR